MLDFRPSVLRFSVDQTLSDQTGDFSIKILELNSRLQSILAEIVKSPEEVSSDFPVGAKLKFEPHRIGKFWTATRGKFIVALGGPPLSGIARDGLSQPVDTTTPAIQPWI